MQAELKGYLDGFSHLSVREHAGPAPSSGTSPGQDAPVVLDPTLLLDRRTSGRPGGGAIPANYPQGGYILCYCISRPGALDTLHPDRLAAGDGTAGGAAVRHPPEGPSHRPSSITGCRSGGVSGPGSRMPPMLCTNSFHGTVFSVQFHQPFFHHGVPGGAGSAGDVPGRSACSRAAWALHGPGHRQGRYCGADWTPDRLGSRGAAAVTAARKGSLDYLAAPRWKTGPMRRKRQVPPRWSLRQITCPEAGGPTATAPAVPPAPAGCPQ